MRKPPVVCTALLALAASSAWSTSFVMMPDEELLAQAPLVVEVEVLAAEPAPTSGRPATDYTIQIESVLKGSPTGSALVVRVPGGVRPDGIGLKIWGAPEFREGERAILFLRPRRDGSFGIVQLMLGAFYRREVEGHSLALRDLAGARQVGGPAEGFRDFQRFAAWLEDRAGGVERPADYFVELPRASAERIVGEFKLFVDGPSGLSFRWFDFPGKVDFRFHQSGIDGQGSGVPQFKTALGAWNADPDTNINYAYAGTTGANAGFTTDDGVNAILFEDPHDEVGEQGDEFSCASGGTLAIGGPWFDRGFRGNFNGQQFIRILEADIVTNDGTACFFSNGKSAEEVFAHEVGHTLGLGHSEVFQALMWFQAHADGRGAQLHNDDRAAIAFLYGTGGGSNPQPPGAPSGLDAVAQSAGAILLSWTDNSGNENDFVIEMRTGTGPFAELKTASANSTSALVSDLAGDTTFSFRVKARNSAGSSGYSNERSAATFAEAGTACVEDASILCLNGGRFRVAATWEVLEAATASPAAASSGIAAAQRLTGDSGYFYFFDGENIEVVAKVLEGCPINGRFWVFLAGLTDVRAVITVLDTQTGMTRTYDNPWRTPFQPIQDTDAFATCP